MKQYLDLLQDVLEHGTVRDDRTGQKYVFLCI